MHADTHTQKGREREGERERERERERANKIIKVNTHLTDMSAAAVVMIKVLLIDNLILTLILLTF